MNSTGLCEEKEKNEENTNKSKSWQSRKNACEQSN